MKYVIALDSLSHFFLAQRRICQTANINVENFNEKVNLLEKRKHREEAATPNFGEKKNKKNSGVNNTEINFYQNTHACSLQNNMNTLQRKI